MELELTKENLQKCGFDDEHIERLIEWNNHDSFLLIDNTCYYATNIEKKIYTEIDGFRKFYFQNGTISFPIDCPDLIPEFFDLSLNNFLVKKRKYLSTMYVEVIQTQKFISIEIEKTNKSIDSYNEKFKRLEYFKKNQENVISVLESYIDLLNNKLLGQPEFKVINISDTSDDNKPRVKDYKETLWFKTGIKLATGEAYKLYSKYKLYKGHFTKICLELGFKETDRPYFSDTINNNTSDKNTFLSNDKLQKLHKHLTENNLPFGAEFLEKYNQIETE
jgi:hypothetical protein